MCFTLKFSNSWISQSFSLVPSSLTEFSSNLLNLEKNGLELNVSILHVCGRFVNFLDILFGHREHNMQSCEEMIYAGSSTTLGQPSLTPPQLQSTMTQLEGMLGRLEHSIKDIVRNLEQKKQVWPFELCTYFISIIWLPSTKTVYNASLTETATFNGLYVIEFTPLYWWRRFIDVVTSVFVSEAICICIHVYRGKYTERQFILESSIFFDLTTILFIYKQMNGIGQQVILFKPSPYQNAQNDLNLDFKK